MTSSSYGGRGFGKDDGERGGVGLKMTSLF